MPFYSISTVLIGRGCMNYRASYHDWPLAIAVRYTTVRPIIVRLFVVYIKNETERDSERDTGKREGGR